MKKQDVEVIEKIRCYDGFLKIDHYRLRHRLFDGGWSGEIKRDLLERGHAVAVMLYDADLDKLVMIEQFRIGAFAAIDSQWFRDDASPWLLEFVAGVIDAGETPEAVARREAQEEAGCTISAIEPIAHYLSSPGGASESVFVLCGQTDASNAGGIHGLDHEGEDIRVKLVSVDEAFALLDQGRINNAMTLIALQWLRIHHADLRKRWRNA